MVRCLIYFSILFLISACAARPISQETIRAKNIGSHSTGTFSQGYSEQMISLCYAKIQKVVGEVRLGRGIIWAECLNDFLRPIEQRNFPDKSDDIARMYQNLIEDMKRFYEGRTTLALLHRRWENAQKSIGYQNILKFKDSHS